MQFQGLSRDYKARLWTVIALNASMFAVASLTERSFMSAFFIPGRGRSGMMGCPMRGKGMMGRGMMAAGACQVVEGRISPMGYCDLYVPLGA